MQPLPDLSAVSSSSNQSQKIEEQGKGKLSGHDVKVSKAKKSTKLTSSIHDKDKMSDGEESHKKVTIRDEKKLRRFSLSHSPRKPPTLTIGKEDNGEKKSEIAVNKTRRLSLPKSSHHLGSRSPLTHQDSTVLIKRKQYASLANQSATPSSMMPTISVTPSLPYIPLISSLTDLKLVILKDKFEQKLGKLIRMKKRQASSASSSSDSKEKKIKESKKKVDLTAIKLLDTALATLREQGAQEAAKALCQHTQFYPYSPSIFAEILHQLDADPIDADPTDMVRQELTQLIFALLAEMDSHALYESHKILKKIALKGWDLYVPITLHLEDHCAKEMVRLILSRPELHNALLFSLPLSSHLSLDDVIDILCQTYKRIEDSKQKDNAIAFLFSLVKASFLSLPQDSCFKIMKFAQGEHSKQQLSIPLLKEVVQQVASLILDKQEELSPQEKKEEIKEKKNISLKSIQTVMDKKDLSFHSLRKIALDLKSFIALSFCQISSIDLLDQNWNKNPSIASHITAFTQKINAITQWAAHCIVKPNTPEQRANRCAFFIELAWQSAQIGDFSTAMALYLSLISSSVMRLEKTWNIVSPQAMQTHKKLTELFSFSRNFENYRKTFQDWWKEREHQDKTPETCPLPLLVNSLKDLTFIYDGNLDIEEGKINEEKLQLLANFYKSLLTCQADLHCSHDALLTRTWSTDMIEKIEIFKLLMTTKAETERLEDELFNRSKRREN